MKKTVLTILVAFCMVLMALPMFSTSVTATDVNNDCITFSGDSSFSINVNKKGWDDKIYYSTDKIEWTEWNGASITAIKNNTDNKYYLYFYGTSANTRITGDVSGNDYKWRITGSSISCTGNIETLRGATGSSPSATVMSEKCYGNMFLSCTALISAPELPATTLAKQCYKAMFSGCASLKSAPELPAINLVDSCYNNMFYGCAELTSPAMMDHLDSLAEYSCSYMYKDCTNLCIYYNPIPGYTKEWKIPADSIGNWNTDMFNNGSNEVTQPDTCVSYYIKDVYTDDCITLLSDSSFSLATENTAKNWNGYIFWSTNKTTWNVWNGEYINCSTSGTDGKYCLYLRGTSGNTYITGNETTHYGWVITGSDVSCTGNIETLRGATGGDSSNTTMANYCYAQLFKDCTALTSAPELTATTLSEGCYDNMFSGCTALTDAPYLPATNLVESCYSEMFSGCKNLANPPVLPATSLASGCYKGMFENCKAMVSAPVLPATTLTANCYNSMFKCCTALIAIPALPAKVLTDSCYADMFNGCTSLLAPASMNSVNKLAANCCKNMYNGCSSLKIYQSNVPDCYSGNWVVNSTVTDSEATDWNTNMFAGTGADDECSFKGDPVKGTTYNIKTIDSTLTDAVYSASLTLNENIDINLVIRNINSTFDNTNLTKFGIYVNGTEINNSNLCLGEDEKNTGHNKVTCVLKSEVPKDMDKVISVTITYDGVTAASFNYSVRKYCEAVFNDTTNYGIGSSLGKLCKATLNYGAYAHMYFDKTTSSMVNVDYINNSQTINIYDSMSTITMPDVVTPNKDSVTSATASLTLGSRTTVNFKIKCSSPLNSSDISVMAYNTTELGGAITKAETGTAVGSDKISITQISGEDYSYQISVKNIGASQLSNVYTLKIGSNDILTYGAYNYCKYVIDQPTGGVYTNSLKTLCKSIYNYGKAANAYVDSLKS